MLIFEIVPAQRREVKGMLVSVKREFHDKEHNLKLRKVGEEFEVPDSRAKRLEELGFVSRIRKPVEKEKPEA